MVAAAAAHDLVRRFRDLRNGLDPADEESDEDDREPHFLDREPSERAPKAWSLFRLTRFARSCTGLICCSASCWH